MSDRICTVCGSTENYIIHLEPDWLLTGHRMTHNLAYHPFQPVERRIAERRVATPRGGE